jgi:hypothetical protein
VDEYIGTFRFVGKKAKEGKRTGKGKQPQVVKLTLPYQHDAGLALSNIGWLLMFA